MAGRVTVRVEGSEELIKKLMAVGADVGKILEAAATAGAAVIANEANTLAPRPIIRSETVERSSARVTVDTGPPDEVWFWRFLETGAQPHKITGNPLVFEGRAGVVVTGAVDHPGMAARPFLRPAFDGQKDNARDEVGSVIKARALR